MKTVLGIFNSLDAASKSYENLLDAGYDESSVSFISKNTTQKEVIEKGPIQNAVSGAGVGATTGGAIGGLAGLLMAAGTLSLPGIGPLLIGGPLVAALGLTGAAATTATGAITGGAVGGLIGTFTGLGMPKETATVYENRVKEGSTVLSIDVEDPNVDRTTQILTDSGAESVTTLNR